MLEINNYEPADIEIHVKNKGMVLKEKSLIAYTESDGKILGFGTEAEEIGAKNIDGVKVISPLRQGMIAEYHAAANMFKYMIKKAWGKKIICKPHMVVCVPKNTTEVERKALEDAMYQAGAKDLMISELSMEQLKNDMMVIDKKRYLTYDIFVVITKNEPEKYISEELSGILEYAAQAGISAERVAELFKNHDFEK